MNTLSVVLPVYNEKASIEKVLSEWQRELRKHPVDYRFVICEDGSTDGTKELLKTITKKYPILLSQKSKRRGYGTAVLDGIAKASSRYILCVDSDGQCDPADFGKFWENKDTADIIIGWRKNRKDAKQRKMFSYFFKKFFKFLFPTSKVHDPSAPYVLFQRRKILPLRSYLSFLIEGFWWGFCAGAAKLNLRTKEIPIVHRDRLSGKTNVYKIGKIPSIAVRNGIGLIRLRFAS